MLTIFSNFRILIAAAVVATLSGCATQSNPVSVADTIATKPELSTLNSLIVQAGLSDTLKSTGPFTVFAPTNAAFAKVPAKNMEDLGKDSAKLKAVLTYHVIPGKIMAAEVKNGNAKTVNGANLALSKAGDFVTVEDGMVQTADLSAHARRGMGKHVEDGMVQTADLSATNGVVHIVDSVLIPPSR